MTAYLGQSTTTTPAVKGENTGTGANAGRGVWGQSDQHDGVAGYSSSSSRYAGYFKNLSTGPGLYAENAGPHAAVRGDNTGTSFSAGRGVWGQSDEHDGVAGYTSSASRYAGYFKNLSVGPGVYSENFGSEPAVKGANGGTGADAGRGVWGESTEHDGVAGYTSSSSRCAGYFKNLTDGLALYGETSGDDEAAIKGWSGGETGVGVVGHASALNGTGVVGWAEGPALTGVWGQAETDGGQAVYGVSYGERLAGIFSAIGVRGLATGEYGHGVEGAAAGDSGKGVYGIANGYDAVGVHGVITNYGVAILGDCWSGLAGLFLGDVNVVGNVYKSGGGFLIDHPIDPANKLLEHSFVESSERKNFYDGIGVADDDGEIVVELPLYFELLNTDFRYQLTPLGRPAPELHVSAEIKSGRFTIAGAAKGQRISWQITGNRKDAWALANPTVVERDKEPKDRGKYRNPELHGSTKEFSIYSRHSRPARDSSSNPRNPPVGSRPSDTRKP